MFVLRSSFSVIVIKKIFGIIYNLGVQISIGGRGKGGVEKKLKINKQGGGRNIYLALKSNNQTESNGVKPSNPDENQSNSQ